MGKAMNKDGYIMVPIRLCQKSWVIRLVGIKYSVYLLEQAN